MTPDLKQALAAKEVLDDYNKNVRVIDITNLTDLGNAKRFVSMHQRNIKFVKKWKCWMIWTGKRWENRDNAGMVPLVEEMIMQILNEAGGMISSDESEKLRKHAKSTEAEGRIMATIRLAQGLPGITADPDDFDNNKYLFNVINGTINLRSGEFREFRREDLLTQTANVIYDPGARAPTWGAFLDRIMANDATMISFLQRAAGYAITGDCSEEAVFLLYGTGANGKSKFIDALAFMMGEYSKKTAVHTVMEMKNESAISSDVAALKGVRFAYASEPNKGRRLDEGKIKDMTGREKISCTRKFCEPEEYQPQFKLFISFNHKPVIRSVDDGIHRRIMFIPFDVKIPDAEKDKGLDEKLHAEASGILNWVLSGVRMWLESGLKFPEKAKKATENYFDEMDSLGEFLDDCCIIEPSQFIPFDDLYNIYVQWCEYKRSYVMTNKAFSQSLNERDIISDKQKGIRGKKGINLNTSVQSALDYSMPISKCLDALDRNLSHRSYIEDLVHIDGNVSNVSNVSTDNYIYTNSQSVQSVQSVHNINILKLLSEKYNKFNKPESIIELGRLQDTMELYILTELDNIEGIDDVDIRRIIDDYFHSRQWQ